MARALPPSRLSRRHRKPVGRRSPTRCAPSPKDETALDDLRAYQKFAQAHVDGLGGLTTTFAARFSAMPDAQKKITDHVFQSLRRDVPGTNGVKG